MWLAVLGFMVTGLGSRLSLASHSGAGSFLVLHKSLSQDGFQWKGFWEVVGYEDWSLLFPFDLFWILPVGSSLLVLNCHRWSLLVPGQGRWFKSVVPLTKPEDRRQEYMYVSCFTLTRMLRMELQTWNIEVLFSCLLVTFQLYGIISCHQSTLIALSQEKLLLFISGRASPLVLGISLGFRKICCLFCLFSSVSIS